MQNLKGRFSAEQLETLNLIGVHIRDDREYSDEDLIEMHDEITGYYILHGFKDDGTPNETARKCESLIDFFRDELDI